MTVLNHVGIKDFKIRSCFGVGGWNLALSWDGGCWSFHTIEQRGEEGEKMMVWLGVKRRRRQ